MPDEDEIRIESEDPEGDERAEAKVKKLRDEVESLRKEKQEYLDGWQRAKADYVNALKRSDEERRVAKEAGLLKALEALLPTYDAIDRAKEHGALPEGFEAIVRQFENAFKTLGVEPLGTVGEHFDPALHEALGQDKAESMEQDGTLTAVLEKGYRVNGAVLRPAKVKVAYFE
jgi:molecular chaperone GrpE